MAVRNQRQAQRRPEEIIAPVARARSDAPTGGSSAVFTDIADGLAPASGGGTSNYLRADGSWATPPSGGSPAYTDITGVPTGTILYRKTAGTGAAEAQTLATLKTDLGLAGTNSGDQTITLTGDVTGGGTGSFATTLATVNSNTGTFGGAASVAQISVNGKGLITGVTAVGIAAPWAALTGVPAAVSNLSGTNTGDQTSVTGNAGTATKLLTARNINGVAFDGTGNITINAVDSTARVPETRTISTTAPLGGGGALTGNLTLTISAATTGAAGSMSAADKTKLDAITGTNTGDETKASIDTKLGATGGTDFYRKDGTWAAAGAGGGLPLPSLYRLASNHTNSTTTPSTIGNATADTDWVHTLVAGKTYYFRIFGLYQSGTAATGGRMNLLGAGGLAGTVSGMMWGAIVQAAAASTLEGPIYSFANGAGAFLLTTAVNPINAPHIWGAEFVFHCTTGGTLALQWASETAVATQLNAGSIMMVQELN